MLERDEDVVQMLTANSSDLNMFDLRYFNAIQSLQDRKNRRNIDDLVVAVKELF